MPLPDRGRGPAGEPVRRRRHARPLRPRERLRGGDLRRPGRDRGAARRPAAAARERHRLPGGDDPPLPVAARLRARRRARARREIRAGEAFQIVLSQRAERPTSASALEIYRALRRVNPSPYLFLLELPGLALIGSSPETHVKCEGTARQPEPDRRHDAPRAGRRGAAARVGEGPRGAHDARRPRAQRPLARLPAGTVQRRAVPRAGAVLARDAPRLGGRGRAAGGRRRRSTSSARPSRRAPSRARRRCGRCS